MFPVCYTNILILQYFQKKKKKSHLIDFCFALFLFSVNKHFTETIQKRKGVIFPSAVAADDRSRGSERSESKRSLTTKNELLA